MGSELSLLFTFGRVDNFYHLLKIGCDLNCINYGQCREEYFERNPQTLNQLLYNVYSNITFEQCLSGGICAPVLDPLNIVLSISLGKYLVHNESYYAFANQHGDVKKSISAQNFENNRYHLRSNDEGMLTKVFYFFFFLLLLCFHNNQLKII